MRRVSVAALALAASLLACKGQMAKIEAVNEALQKDDAAALSSAIEGYPTCTEGPPLALLPKQSSSYDTGCLAAISSALGSKKGFNWAPPDQAAATTAAIILLRDGRGDWLAHIDDWLGAVRTGKGPGPDSLRLAIAKKMAAAAPRVGRRLEEEKDALDAMKAIAGAVPGACATYWLLGSGTDASKLLAEHSAEHAACVHKDLGRREGPGSSYGAGTFRALEGSLAVWRETERALRLGLATSAPTTKTMLETKLKTIEAATIAIATKKIASTSPIPVVEALGEMHADAGVILWKPKDAGAEAAAPAPSK